MDLKRALDRIRADFKSDTESLAQSDILSEATLSSENYCRTGESDNKNFNGTNFGKNGNHKGEEFLSKIFSNGSRLKSVITFKNIYIELLCYPFFTILCT